MLCAGARDAAGQNLASFRDEVTERRYILVIQRVDVIDAALADLSSRSSDSISLIHCVSSVSYRPQNGISSSVLDVPN